MRKKYLMMGIIIAAFILCVVILGVVIRFLPLIQAAQTLRRVAQAERIEYEVNVSLNPQSFSKEQEQFLQVIAWILEVDEESCMDWSVGGAVSGGKGYAQVFCEGMDSVVTDVYFAEDYVVVNVGMLYETLQKNFANAHPILGNLLPDWKYSDYISLEQIEEIFHVDIKEMYQLDLPQGFSRQSMWKGLMMLHEMERGESEDKRQQFEMVWNDYQMKFAVGKAGQTPELSIQGEDTKNRQIIASYQAEVSSGGEEEIIFPKSVMGQEEVEKLKDMWSIVEEIRGTVSRHKD